MTSVESIPGRDGRLGDPGMKEAALQEMVNAQLLPPGEGQVENLLLSQISVWLASLSVVHKFSVKEQFSLSLGPKRVWMVVCDAMPCHSQPPLCVALLTQSPLRDTVLPGLAPMLNHCHLTYS